MGDAIVAEQTPRTTPKWKEEELLSELGKTAKEVIELDNAYHFIDASEDPITADRIAYRLTSAEQEFFLLFNTFRTNNGYEPLDGKRFTGDFSYESYLYGF